MASVQRQTPFDLVFATIAEERFPAIRGDLEAGGRDARDRDAFLMERGVAQLVRDLRPDEGLGEGIDQLAALVHHAYLFWLAGTPTLTLTPSDLQQLLADGGDRAVGFTPPAFYAALPARRIWSVAVPGENAEPLDGCFLARGSESISVLAVFGIRADRAGFTVAEAEGHRPERLARPDGSPLFASQLAGGSGLASLAGGEELLELGWRLVAFAAERSA